LGFGGGAEVGGELRKEGVNKEGGDTESPMVGKDLWGVASVDLKYYKFGGVGKKSGKPRR